MLELMATSANDYVNLGIAIGTFAGGAYVALMRLRTLIRNDNRSTIREELSPFAQTQADHGRDIVSLKEWRPGVDEKLQTHAEGIAYLKGKEDARSEMANGLSGVGHLADALSHQEEKHEGDR